MLVNGILYSVRDADLRSNSSNSLLKHASDAERIAPGVADSPRGVGWSSRNSVREQYNPEGLGAKDGTGVEEREKAWL